MLRWLTNIYTAVVTVGGALWVSLRYWGRTYDPKRRTFTEQYEYPELPVALAPRFRGFHRFDLALCNGCERCARDCPVACIYVDKQRAKERKGFEVLGFTIDYAKCMICGICAESCPTAALFMGSSYDLSCYSRSGCLVDFARLPREIAWGAATLNPTAVALSKAIAEPVNTAK